MEADHLRLHSLVHVSKEPGVRRDGGEDHLAGVREDEAQHLQAGAHTVN